MFSCYVGQGLPKQALVTFDEMVFNGTTSNSMSLSSIFTGSGIRNWGDRFMVL